MKRLLVALLVAASIVGLPTRTAFFRPFTVHAATFTNKNLFKGALTATLTTTLYTVPGATSTLVLSILISNNNTTTTRAVTIKGGVVGSTVSFVPALAVPANNSFSFQVNHFLATTEVIQGGQDTGTDVDVWITGAEIT